MSKADAIFTATPKWGNPVWDNRIDFERYMLENEGIEIQFSCKQTAKLTEKQRMYNFLFGPLMICAVRGYSFAGYEGIDPVKARYKLEAEFSKHELYNSKTKQTEIYILSVGEMTKAELRKFIEDCLYFLEYELKQDVPNSAEYKAMKAGDEFIPVKPVAQKPEPDPVVDEEKYSCDACGGDFTIQNIIPSWDKDLNGGKGATVQLCTTCYTEIYPEDQIPK